MLMKATGLTTLRAVAKQVLPGSMKRRLRSMISRSSGDGRRRQLLRLLPKESIGAEIGVWKGDFSEEILRLVRPRELHLIDPWMFQLGFASRWYGGAIAKSQIDMDLIYQNVLQRFATYPTVRRKNSCLT